MDRHLKLNQKFYDQIDKIKSKTMRYRSHLERSKSHLEIARTISKEDIFDRLGALKENPSVYTHPWHEHNKKEKQFGYDKIDNDGGEF